MKAPHLLLLLILYPILGYTQPKHSFFFNTGYTYNTPIELDEEAVENSQGFLFRLGGVKKMFFYKENYFELGLATKIVFASGEIGGESFDATTLRIEIPAKFVFPVAPRWEVATGFIIQNNADFNSLDLRLRNKYDWRYNLFGEVKYWIKEDWYLTTSGNFNIRSIPDPFFINDPKVAFSVGVGKRVLIVRKKRDARRAKRKQKRKQKRIQKRQNKKNKL